MLSYSKFIATICALFLATSVSAQDNSKFLEELLSLIRSGDANVSIHVTTSGAQASQSVSLIGLSPGHSGGLAPPTLGYTCTGGPDGGECTCSATDTCGGMKERCGKLGGKVVVCPVDSDTCTCEFP